MVVVPGITVVVVASSAVFGNLGTGDGTNGTADEGSGFISDEGTGSRTEGTTDEGSPFSWRARGESQGGKGEQTEFQGLFHDSIREVTPRENEEFLPLDG